jgi:hypothetical protein
MLPLILPRLSQFSDDFFGGAIHGDLGGGETIVASETVDSGTRGDLLDRGDRRGVTSSV